MPLRVPFQGLGYNQRAWIYAVPAWYNLAMPGCDLLGIAPVHWSTKLQTKLLLRSALEQGTQNPREPGRALEMGIQ